MLVKTVRKTLFKTTTTGVMTMVGGEREKPCSTINKAKTAEDLWPTSRLRGSMGGEVLRGDINGRGDSCERQDQGSDIKNEG